MTPRPLRGSRIANSLPGALICLFGLAVWLDEAIPFGWELGILVPLLGAVLTVRGYRVGVRCDDRAVTVYGLLWTRAIPKAPRAAVPLTQSGTSVVATGSIGPGLLCRRQG